MDLPSPKPNNFTARGWSEGPPRHLIKTHQATRLSSTLRANSDMARLSKDVGFRLCFDKSFTSIKPLNPTYEIIAL